MKILKWFSDRECKEAISEFVEKYYSHTLTVNDTSIFFKAFLGMIYSSKERIMEEEDGEIWEDIKADVEEFGSMAFCFEVWGSEFKFIIMIDKEDILLGEYEGIYKPLENVNYSAWISLMPDCQIKMMNGGLINKHELINLDCVIIGSVKVVIKPRNWIQNLFTNISSEPIQAFL